MDVIVFEKESFYKLIDELTNRIIKSVERNYREEEWIDDVQAKKILGIKSKAKLQQLRDNLNIEFSQFGKIIRYSKSSILQFLENNRVTMDRI